MTAEMGTPLGIPLGIHLDVQEDEYHKPQLGVARCSSLKHVRRSPLHYLTWLHSPKAPTPDMIFGRRFHHGALEPALFASRYTVEPAWGSCRKNDADGTTKEQGKANKKRRDAWRADNADKELIGADDMEAIRGMTDSLSQHPLASKLLSGGQSEVTVTWQDDETGLYCQARPDYWVRDRKLVVDLKSCDDASPEGFAKACAKFDYPLQNAMYRDGLAAAGAPAEHFVLVAVEKEPPYAVGLYEFDGEDLEVGYTRFRQGLALMADAVNGDNWRGYSESIETLELPRWYRNGG